MHLSVPCSPALSLHTHLDFTGNPNLAFVSLPQCPRNKDEPWSLAEGWLFKAFSVALDVTTVALLPNGLPHWWGTCNESRGWERFFL